MVRIPIWTAKREAEVLAQEKASTSQNSSRADITLHPVASKDALIVKVSPPEKPAADIHHVACDIVLVIDVSGSMGINADVPGETESTGLSVIDLTKHAAMTIIETLNADDRLGIVTFGSKSIIVQDLTPMTDANKDVTRTKVKEIQLRDATNLWHGILDGIKLFKKGGSSNRVPALMVLTDGRPNHMCPNQGYIPKLRSMPPLPASIHTFGFGYNLESGLLKSIAEFGGGNYAFIPDAGMIGTVFVHAVANLQTTFATKTVVTLSYKDPLFIREIVGDYVGKHLPEDTGSKKQIKIDLGNLQYGQTRDLFLSAKGFAGLDPINEGEVTTVTASLEYQPTGIKAKTESTNASCSMLADTKLTGDEVAYHESRTRICKFLASIFPLSSVEVHTSLKGMELQVKQNELQDLIDELPSRNYTDALNQSLVEDLAGQEPKGQVSIAMKNDEHFLKWGVHYLPSIHNAHTRQICNSFKDPGPLQYGTQSPLFLTCRNRLDNAFDNLPAPEPTVITYRHGRGHSSSSRTPISMARYHVASGVCFAGSTPVQLASGRRVPIRKLRRGVKVRTPAGPRRVAVVLKTAVESEMMCQVRGGILVTPWHPICSEDSGKRWTFPAHESEGNVRYTGRIYSVMLEMGDGRPRGHALRVGDVWGVTLGHGITSGNDSRAHHFFGDYRRVAKNFLGMGLGRDGVVAGGGVERDEETGLVKGFRKPMTLRPEA